MWENWQEMNPWESLLMPIRCSRRFVYKRLRLYWMIEDKKLRNLWRESITNLRENDDQTVGKILQNLTITVEVTIRFCLPWDTGVWFLTCDSGDGRQVKKLPGVKLSSLWTKSKKLIQSNIVTCWYIYIVARKPKGITCPWDRYHIKTVLTSLKTFVLHVTD